MQNEGRRHFCILPFRTSRKTTSLFAIEPSPPPDGHPIRRLGLALKTFDETTREVLLRTILIRPQPSVLSQLDFLVPLALPVLLEIEDLREIALAKPVAPIRTFRWDNALVAPVSAT